MDRLRAMHVFVTVASAGSLSAAARKLGVPLTTVSRQLAALEDHVGTGLIARTTRRLALTTAGRRYLETCTTVLDELAAVEERLAGRNDPLSGEITITAPVVFGRLHVLPILLHFMSQYPKVDARLHLADRVIDLTEDSVDVAVRIGNLPDSALLATRVGSLRLLTCAAPDYLRERGRPASPGALASHDCIGFSTLADNRRWIFDSKAYGRCAVRIHARLQVTTAEAAIDAAVAGLGVARLLSYQAADAIARKRLATLLTGYDDTSIPIHVVRRDVRRPNAQTRLLSEFLVRELRACRFTA